MAEVRGTQRPAPAAPLIVVLDLGTTSTCFEIDGTDSLRCLWSIVSSLSNPSLAALFVIIFVYGWNQ